MNNKSKLIHKQYKRSIKHEKRSILMWQFTLSVLFIGMWELAGSLLWIDPFLFSSPSKILIQINEWFADGSFLVHLQATVIEVIIGCIVGTLIGVMLAIILWSSSKLSRIVSPYLIVGNTTLVLIVIVILGPGITGIVAMGVVMSAVITTLIVHSAFKNVDSNYLNVLKSFGASRRQCFKEAVFPATLPTIISMVKVNVGISSIGIIVGELLISNQGLGYLMAYGLRTSNFTLVLSSLILTTVWAGLMYKIIKKMEHMIKTRTK